MISSFDWESKQTHLILNPRLPSAERGTINQLYNEFSLQLPGHIWLLTSGSTGENKLVALSKEAFLCSAQAVNQHLEVTTKDKWLKVLPDFHVGGLGIYARAHQAQISSFNCGWEVPAFLKLIIEKSITLTALVPTQVYDLIREGLSAPKCLRAVVVGGADLDEGLYFKGRELGWPLLPSYGMTETCSQVATASLQSLSSNEKPQLKKLSHVELQISASEQIMVRSRALLSGYAFFENNNPQFFDPKQEGWLVTDDLGILRETDHLLPLGRKTEMIKINGETVSLLKLRRLLGSLCEGELATILAVPHLRSGYVLHLFVNSDLTHEAPALLQKFNSLVMPFERLNEYRVVEEFPRTEIGKIDYKKMVEFYY